MALYEKLRAAPNIGWLNVTSLFCCQNTQQYQGIFNIKDIRKYLILGDISQEYFNIRDEKPPIGVSGSGISCHTEGSGIECLINDVCKGVRHMDPMYKEEENNKDICKCKK